MNQSELNTFVNPFSTKFWTPGTIPFQFSEESKEDDETKWDINVLIEQKINYGSIMQIVGSHGSGKSTLLRTLLQHLEQQHFVIRLEELNDRRHKLLPDFLPVGHDRKMFYMIDGYEQLSFWERFRLRFQKWDLTGGLLLTTHKPVFGIPILYRTTPQFELFIKLVRELTKTYSATYSHSFGTTELYEIYHRAGGNFRTAFFELYDIVQTAQNRQS